MYLVQLLDGWTLLIVLRFNTYNAELLVLSLKSTSKYKKVERWKEMKNNLDVNTTAMIDFLCSSLIHDL